MKWKCPPNAIDRATLIEQIKALRDAHVGPLKHDFDEGCISMADRICDALEDEG